VKFRLLENVSYSARNEPFSQHTRRTLVESHGISAVDFRCSAGVERAGPEEPNPTHSIVFVRRGVFGRTHRRENFVADPNHILFFNKSEPYRYSHPIPGGDDCTILTIDATIAPDLVAVHSPREAERLEAPFRIGYAPCSNRAAWLHYELLGLVRRQASLLSLEDALSELAHVALRSAYESLERIRQTKPLTFGAMRRRYELCESVKVTVNERIATLPSLRELADDLNCSPFHLSRLFHQTTGMSLRRYVSRLRASMAAERLAKGQRDLTDLALELGFSDHSHFTNAFRKEWGVPPSRFRARRFI